MYDSEKCRRTIGYVTSAMWSPAVKANIGELWAEVYKYKDLRPYRRMVRAKIMTRPFWTHPRARATPPLDY
jgi:aminomethyltransferase